MEKEKQILNMKKIIFATMVAIAMFVGIQPVFAGQFTTPEVSTSDNQCYVLDLPAGATAEAPEYAAPWQVPEVKAVESYSYETNILHGELSYVDINTSGASSVTINATKDTGYPTDCFIEGRWIGTGEASVTVDLRGYSPGVANTSGSQSVYSSTLRVYLYLADGATGTPGAIVTVVITRWKNLFLSGGVQTTLPFCAWKGYKKIYRIDTSI